MPDFVDNTAGYSEVTGTADYLMTTTGTGYHLRLDQALTDGQQVAYYAIGTSNGVPAFESGVSNWDDSENTLVVDTITNSSNGGGKISWDAGTKTIYIVHNSASMVNTTDTRLVAVDSSDLDPAAALDRSEIVAIDQGGDGVQTTVGDILDANMFGGMVITNNAVAEGTVGAFPAIRIVQAWTANDPSNFIVPDYTAGTLTVPTGGDGAYFITANIYAYTGSNSKTYTFAIFKNTGPFGLRICSQLTSGSGAGSNLSMSVVIDLVAGDVISLYVLSSDGGTAMTVTYGDIFMQRMGA